MKHILIFLGLFFFINTNILYSQIKGGLPTQPSKDSVYIFAPARPLLTQSQEASLKLNAYGIDLFMSNSGFGVGAFYQKFFDDELSGLISLYISGARNTDEFDSYITQNGNTTIGVVDKINRLYKFPLMFGVQQRLFKDVLSANTKPFISAGVGPTFIVSTPYDKGWFDSFNYAKFYVRPGIYFGAGSYFGNPTGSLLGVNLRYYYIPFGGDGLESIKNLPIKDFGGVFISITLAGMF